MAINAVPESMYELGQCYISEIGTDQDIDKAFACFSNAAQNGLPETQFELGGCYRYGEATEQNIKTAMYWYEKATSQCYLRTYHNMGIIYQNGLGGVSTGYDKAFYYIKKTLRKKS